MDSGSTTSARRLRARTVSLGALALACFLAALAWLPRSYQEQATLAILPASASASAGLAPAPAGPSLRQVAGIVSHEVMSARTVRRLAARKCRQPYVVGLEADSAGSALVITVTGSSPGRAQRTLRAVIGQVAVALARRVGRSRGRNVIQVTSLTSSVRPALDGSPAARPEIVAGLLGAVLALGCPVVIDARRIRRRSGPGPTPRR